ncbi:trypsin-like peptidase domain-containing protein [Streptomyces sp. SudanB182_2057]|uniref:S1C family serine protease n=1 Tax=Streptomyces sp. SudanB182_2057 TaxID=3035281 RepID=UPI003F546083
MNEGNGVPPTEPPTDGPQGTTGTPPTAPTPDGDFELPKPTPTTPSGTSGETGGEAGRETGEMGAGPARPVATVNAPEGAGAAGRREVASPESGAVAGSAGVPEAVAVSAGGSGGPGGEAVVPDSGERAGAERITPLHDPDPYSTPPYGEPGPWAPAPPVQHPAFPPAYGTALPAPPAPPIPTAPGAPAPPVPQDAPAPQAPGPAVAPAPQTPAPVMAPAPPAPAPATALAPQAPHPTPSADPAFPPPHGTPAPQPQGPEPTTMPGAAVLPGPEPVPVPDVAALSGPAPEAAPPPSPQGGAGADPWAGYDPWVAAQEREPLQQTGAKVLTRAQRRRRAWRWVIGWTLAVAVVSGGIGGAVGAYVEHERLGGVRLPRPGSVPAGRAPDSVAGIAARALPGVVTLHVRGDDGAGTGTGFVLDTEGHILTNNHVVEPAGPDGEITVTFDSGDTVEAEVVGRDGGYDLAVVRVHGVHDLTPLPLGDSDDVRVGDPVVAIGAPFDLAGTVTSGVISAKERPITAGGEKSDGSDTSYVDALQTDAPINPGNSGGPLLDSHARVIGVNTAIRSAGGGSDPDGDRSGSIGLGFAIPVNQAERVAGELIDHGHATHPVIGVTLDMGHPGDGARIGGKGADGGPAVTPGGPGDRAGLKAGDVITEADGARVRTGRELIVRIRAHRPGDRLRLTVERGGTEREVSLVLGASEQN